MKQLTDLAPLRVFIVRKTAIKNVKNVHFSFKESVCISH